MASFQKRGKTWQYTISRMVNGKSCPIRKSGFRTKKEAQVAASEIESELRVGVVPHLKLEPFDVYIESWVKTFKTNITNNTLERYLNTVKTVREYFNGVPIQNINKRTYQIFINEYGKTHTKATTRKLNTHIRSCVLDAIEEGIIRTNFTRNVNIVGLEGKRDIDKYINYEDSKRLLNNLYTNLDRSITHYLLLLALTSGMRFGEIVGLTRNDFDFFNNTINIDKSWGYTKNMDQGFGNTKNEQSKRVIKIDDNTMSVFKSLFKNTPDNIMRLVFYSPKSKYHVISNNMANKLLKSILNDLNINTISIHGLRHTHGSLCLYEGATPNYVMDRLGHKDIQTTMGVYIHVIKELRQRDESKSIEAFKRMYV